MARRTRRALTLTDLVVVLAIVALLASVLLQSGNELRRASNRGKCAKNLRALGQALLLYANENKGRYPQTVYRPDAPPTQYTGAHAANPFEEGGPGPNDVTAGLFLLIRTQDITPSVFVCPSTGRVAWELGASGKAYQQVSNFPSEQHLGYSYANPYRDPKAPSNRILFEYGWMYLPAAADMNPGQGDGFDATLPKSQDAPQEQMFKANSRNHLGAGQNVLFNDGHVDFVENPFVGATRDNIYTVAGGTWPNLTSTSGTIVGEPKSRFDIVLLPVATATPPMAGVLAERAFTPAMIIGGVAILAVVGLAARVVRKRKARLRAAA